MKIALIVLGVVAALIVVIVLIGYSLPVKHRAQVTATIAAPPDQVYALITMWRHSPPGVRACGLSRC